MKTNPLVACLATLVLALAGCTMQPLVSQGTVPVVTQGEGATLSLGFNWQRQIQAVPQDVTGATVSIRVNGREPIVRSFTQVTWATESVDISNLPGGDALIRVEAFSGPNKIGEGERAVPLLIGRRTFASLDVRLDGHGRTNLMPFTPLGPLPDPTARLIIREIRFRTGGLQADHHEVILENRTGQPIYGFERYGLVYSGPQPGETRTPFLMVDGNPETSDMPSGFLAAGATVSIALDEQGDVSGGRLRSTFGLGLVQHQAGSLALVRSNPSYPPETLVDYVQWGQPGFSYESRAMSANLWAPGDYVSTLDPTDLLGFRCFVTAPGERGATNWETEPIPLPGEPSPPLTN